MTTTKIEVKPAEPKQETEEKTEQQQIIPDITTEKESDLLPEPIKEKEAQYILEELYNLLAIYYSANQISAELPKEARWYLSQVLAVFEKTGIIVR